jgi:predicted dehydrogenase
MVVFMADRTQLGVGLISVGWMGKVHSRAYADLIANYPQLPVHPRFVIAADPEPSRQDFAKEALGYETATADYMEVLRNPDVDVVSICSPNFLHKEIALAAIAHGKHVWLEKPAGRGVQETREIAEAAAAAGVTTTIGFNYRHAPAIEYGKQLISEGALGRITNVRGIFFADYSSEPNGALSWRFKRELAGSGVLGDLMGHLVDLVQYLVGDIAEVTALTSTTYKQRPFQQMGKGTHFDVIEGGPMGDVENEDYAGMLVRFADSSFGNEAVGTLEASRSLVGPRARYEIEIYGTEGSFIWDFERMNEMQLTTARRGVEMGYRRVMAGPGMGDFGAFQPGAGTSLGYDDLKVVEARKFVEAILGSSALNSNINDAVSSAAVLDAAEKSAASKTWFAIEPVSGTTSAKRKA